MPARLAASTIPDSTSRVVDLATYLDQPVGQTACWLRVESVDSDRVRLTVATTSADDLLDALNGQITRLGADERRRG